MLTAETQKLIFELSMNMLNRDILTNSTFMNSDVGKNLRSLIIQDRGSLKLTNPTAKALSGKIRSDANFLRQASSNVTEAKSVTDTAESSVQTVREKLERMQEIATGVGNGTLTASAVSAEYDSLYSEIQGAIRSPSFNGINLLDSSNWASDERVTLSGTSGNPGAVGKIHIQAGNEGFDLVLFDMKFLADGNFSGDLSSLSGLDMASATDLTNTTAATTSATELSELVSYVKTFESAYEGRSTNLNSQASSLASQAAIMDTAAKTRESSNDSRSLEQLLLDYIAKQSGSLINTSS